MKAAAIEVLTTGDLLDRAAARSDSDALVFPEETASYPELADHTRRLARSLYGLGVRRGDKVGILMHNCMDFAATLFAAGRLGAVDGSDQRPLQGAGAGTRDRPLRTSGS